MQGINHVTLVGNLTRDPQQRTTGNTIVCSFGLAVNRTWRDRDGNDRADTCFVECTAWGKLAELCGRLLSKGSPVFVDGRLRYESWEDSGGTMRNRLTVTAEQVRFFGARSEPAQPQSQTQQADDDIPF